LIELTVIIVARNHCTMTVRVRPLGPLDAILRL